MEPLELLGADPLLTIYKERTIGDALNSKYHLSRVCTLCFHINKSVIKISIYKKLYTK